MSKRKRTVKQFTLAEHASKSLDLCEMVNALGEMIHLLSSTYGERDETNRKAKSAYLALQTLRSNLDNKICAETPMDYPAISFYYGHSHDVIIQELENAMTDLYAQEAQLTAESNANDDACRQTKSLGRINKLHRRNAVIRLELQEIAEQKVVIGKAMRKEIKWRARGDVPVNILGLR